jgi:outer membrane protein assembly factor BamE (lipoprotein component of BamABCDE complex)
MTNDETIRLMNSENTKQWFRRPSSFEFRHFFGIRHLSFVIFSIFRFLLLLLLVLVVSCTGQRITKANVEQVAEGMSKKQVESILGPPTDIDTKDFVIMKKTTYVYRQGKDTVTIVFKDDKVTEKQSTLAD